MMVKTCGHFYKSYNPSSILNLLGSTFSISISLLQDFDKLFKSLILSEHFTALFNTLFAILFNIKYIKKNL